MKHKNTAYISRDALRQNFLAVEKIVADNAQEAGRPKPRVICVVKADGYGHGIAAVAGTLGSAGCGFFAVSSEDEAVELREIEHRNGRHPEILILGRIMPENVGEMIEEDITCAVVSLADAEELSAGVTDYNRRSRRANEPPASLKIHIKLDTGMNRVGFAADEQRLPTTVSEIGLVSADPNLSIAGIFTHFSCADDELMDGHPVPGYEIFGGYTGMQFARYKAALAALEDRGIPTGLKHCANSAAALCLPDAYFDAVRAGVIIYGLLPNGSIDPRFRPAMQFVSTVTHLHTIVPGDRVSYGATFEAEKPMTVATVAAGYADGFERAYAGCCVRIGDRMFRQIGRICMDQFMVDVTPDEGEECPVRVGDPVILFGGDDGLMTDTLARLAGTINYEVVCKVSKRVPRVVL